MPTSINSSPINPKFSPKYIVMDGQQHLWDDAMVHVNSVGHSSVSAVFEGLRAYRNRTGELLLFRPFEHIDRLQQSARMARLEINYDDHSIAKMIGSLLVKNEFDCDVYVRPWAYLAGVVRSQLAQHSRKTHFVIDSWGIDSKLDDLQGCSTCVSSWTKNDSNATPPSIKAFSNYHNSRLACIEAAERGADWPILLNARHKVSEGPGACLAIIKDGSLITPDLASDILNSITRDTILRLSFDDLSISCTQRPMDRTELYSADEAFFMGTGWEVLPILSVDGLKVGDGKIGPVTRKLAMAYSNLVRGNAERSTEWCVPVSRLISSVA